MNLFYYILIAAPFFALRDLIYKYYLDSEINIIVFTCLWVTLAGILACSYLLFYFMHNPKEIKLINKKFFLYSCIVAILSLIGFIIYFKVLSISPNPEIIRTLFSSLLIIFIMIFSIFKNNYLNFHQYVGIFFVLVGMFLTYNKNLKIL